MTANTLADAPSTPAESSEACAIACPLVIFTPAMRLISTILVVAAITLTTTAAYAQEQFPYGRFIGVIETKWMDDDRNMELTKPFVYVDPKGVRWEAPKGSVIDGASIPQFGWSIVGGPYEGGYRKASVIHDVACREKTRSWESVHLAFYHAMLAANVQPVRAKVMYAAVYYLGPRWPRIRTIPDIPEDRLRDRIAFEREQFSGFSGEVSVDIRPKGGGLASIPGRGSNSGGKVDLVLTWTPEESPLRKDEFSALKHKIEAEDLTLTDIQRYVPPQPPQ